MSLTKKQKEIIKVYAQLAKKNTKYPSRSDLIKAGVSRDRVRDHFGNMEKLKTASIAEKPASFAKLTKKKEPHPYQDFTREGLGSIVKEKEHKNGVFFVTAAAPCSYLDVSPSELRKMKKNGETVTVAHNLFTPGFEAVKNFLGRNKAELIILPMPAHVRALEDQPAHYDPELFSYRDKFVTEYTFNSHLKALEAYINPQQTNPLTGMVTLKVQKVRTGSWLPGQEIKPSRTSLIIGHSKQMMETVATGNDTHPRIVHSTGAITKPSYLRNRIGMIADSDHKLGGLIIEIEGGTFYVRQVQMDPVDGSFIDIGTRYHADGTVTKERAKAFKMGDIHPGLQDPAVLECWYDLWDIIKPEKIFYEDFFDGKSISHHLEKKRIERAQRPEYFRTLANELKMAKSVLEETFDHAPADAELIATASNHPEHLMRYLEEGRYHKDDVNHELAHRMVVMTYDKKNPLQEYLDPEKRMRWTDRNEDIFVQGVQMNAHGDMGVNGTRASKQGHRKNYGDAMVAHSHTPSILNDIFTVGHSTIPRHGYNNGPSTWIPCSGAVYERGQKQLYMVVNGKYRRAQKKKK